MKLIHSYQYMKSPIYKLCNNKKNILNEKNEKIIGLLNIPNNSKLFSININRIKKKKKI